MWKEHRKNLLLIVIAGVAVYLNALWNDFVWDDWLLLLENKYIKDFAYLKDIFFTNLSQGGGVVSLFYRPIQSLSFMIDYFFWKDNPFGYHLSSILIHIVNGVLVYFLCVVVGAYCNTPLLVSLLWVIHPIHTQAVTYIAGRADPLAVMFILLALIIHVTGFRIQDSNSKLLFFKIPLTPFKKGGIKICLLYSVSCILYIFALLSKEMAVIFPLLVLLVHMTREDCHSEPKVKNLCRYTMKATKQAEILHSAQDDKDKPASCILHLVPCIPYFIITAIYAVLRFTVFKSNMFGMDMAEYPFYTRLLTLPKVVISYILIILLPLNLHIERTLVMAKSVFELSTLLYILGFAVLISLVVFAYKKLYLTGKSKLIFIGSMWFLISLIPVSNLFALDAAVAEHWLYLPSIGFFMVLGGLVQLLCHFSEKGNLVMDSCLRRNDKIVKAVIISVVCFYGFLTIARNFDWKNSRIFFEKNLKYTPNSSKIHGMLGLIYEREGRLKDAEKEYKKAIKLNSKSSMAYTNLGNVYSTQGRIKESIAMYKKAIEINPNSAQAHGNLGNAYNKLEDFNNALKEYQYAVILKKDYLRPAYAIADIYFKNNMFQEAVWWYNRAIQINHGYEPAYHGLAKVLSKLGKQAEIINLYNNFLKERQDSAVVYFNLGNAYIRQKDFDKAIDNYNKAIKIDNTYADAYNNLANCYAEKHMYRQAVKNWEKAVDLKPELEKAKENIRVLKKKGL